MLKHQCPICNYIKNNNTNSFIIIVIIILCLALAISARGELYDCKPVNNINYPFSKILSDLESHCTRPNIYREQDYVTSAHELTHGVNSDLRNSTPPGDAYFYILNSKAYRVIVPKNVTILQVKLQLPYIGSAFQTYFSTRVLADWNDDVTFFLDEWNAYLNGCLCGLEQNMMDRTLTSFDHANQLGLYSILATKHLNQKDINDYVAYNMERTEYIKNKLPGYNRKYYDTLIQYYSSKTNNNTDNNEIIRSE